MQKKKILILTDRDAWDRLGESIYNIAVGFDRDRCDPVFLDLSGGILFARVEEAGVTTASVEIDPDFLLLRESDFFKPQKFFELLKSLPVTRRLIKTVREYRPDAILTTTAMTHLLGSAAGRLTGTDVVWRFSEFFRPPYRYIFTGTALWGANRVVCASKLIAGQFGGMKKVSTVYDGIDLDKIKPEKRWETVRETILKLPLEANIIGTASAGTAPYRPVSAGAADKGPSEVAMRHITFLQAAEQVCARKKNICFVIAGRFASAAGDEREELLSYITELGIGHRVSVVELGADRYDILNSFDVFVYQESDDAIAAAPPLEAMALGKVVVSGADGCTREIIRNGVSGICITPGRPDRLAEISLELLENPEVMDAISKNALERVREHFDLKKQIRRIEDALGII